MANDHNTKSTDITAQRNGRTASAADLAALAFAGYAHFTAMQVRDGKVRGLDLHLQRLDLASKTLFGRALGDSEVREWLRASLELRQGDFSMTATVYSPAGEFTAAGDHLKLDMLVRTAPASNSPNGPLAFAVFEHERVLPEIKHVGEVAKTWFLRQAVAQNFHDAAFTDRLGRLSEGSIWNLAFWDGESVIWPRAAMLRGTTMGIVMRQLERMGIPQREQEITLDVLPRLRGAAAMNSWTPGIEVQRFGAVDMPSSPEFLALLHKAYLEEPAVAL